MRRGAGTRAETFVSTAVREAAVAFITTFQINDAPAGDPSYLERKGFSSENVSPSFADSQSDASGVRLASLRGKPHKANAGSRYKTKGGGIPAKLSSSAAFPHSNMAPESTLAFTTGKITKLGRAAKHQVKVGGSKGTECKV